MRVASAILAAMLFAAPAAAQRRDLPVPVGKGWKHADSGIVLTATLAGLARTTLTDNGTTERDVAAEFALPDRSTIATIYIFHPALMSVAIWFDRAQTAIDQRELFGGVTPTAPLPSPFVRPGGTTRSGLRQSYVPRRSKFRSTALAIAPVGEWLVAIRLSSTMLDAAAADAKMSELIAAVRWPTAADDAPAAQPIAGCADKLHFVNAKVIKPDMMQALLGGAIAAAALKADRTSAEPVEWCRDPAPPVVSYGVYRAAGANDGYTLAIGDSGRVAGVSKALALPGQSVAGGYTVDLRDLDGSVSTFASFDALPEPEQVLDVILGTHGPIAQTTRSKNGQANIKIDAGQAQR